MTRGSARHKLAWRSGAAVALALAAMAGGAPAEAQSAQPFSPPQSGLLLSRTLVRSLPDGKTITTRRSYEVRFTRVGAGFRVDGELLDVSVDAPPSLLALADLERRRPDNGLFPIQLDASGMIASAREPLASPAIDRAAALVSQRIGGSGLAALDMAQAQAFVARLRSGAARNQWPDDVFRPAIGKRSEARKIVLPGGDEGQVVIEIEGQGAGPGGQVAAVDRVVTTELAGDQRTTRERWQISRFAGGGDLR